MNNESDPQPGHTSPLDASDLSSLNQTSIVAGGLNRIKRLTEEQQAVDNAVVTNPQSVALVVRGITEPIRFSDGKSDVVLGRSDLRSPQRPDLDLTHLGAAERGVSRRHARLELADGRLYITDLDSSNGTFVNGVRLNPYTPTLLHSGDDVLLARLAFSVTFE